MDTNERLLTRHQAARRAKVTYNTILLWERAGRLHPTAIKTRRGERFFIRERELEAISRDEPAFDPSLVWHHDELVQPNHQSLEPDPDPESAVSWDLSRKRGLFARFRRRA